MTQPFVVSVKMVADGRQLVGETREARREIEALQRVAANPAASARQAAINSAVGLDKATVGNRGADIAAYGAELDSLRARFNPLYAAEQQHLANLQEIDRAYRLGAISAGEQTAAVERERSAHLAAVAALDGHTFAINANNAALSRSNAQRTNLLFQLQDIGVSLASGMNPLMVFAQQGSQISMIYGPEEGGLGRAFQETGKMGVAAITRLAPFVPLLLAIATGFAGLRHEIEETSGVSVSFGDTFLAVFQVVGGYLYDTFKPQIEAIQGWFAWVWELVVAGTRNAGNWIIRNIVSAVEYVKTSVASLPPAFIVMGEAAAQGLVDAISAGVNNVIANVDTLIDGVNGLAGRKLFEKIGPIDPFKVDIGGTQAVKDYENAWLSFGNTVGALAERDFMGEFFSDVQAQAIENYNNRLKDTDKAARQAANGIKIADDAAKAFKESIDFYRDTFRSFFTDMRQNLSQGKTFWEALGAAGASALERIADRALGMAADGIFNMIMGAFMPGFGQTGGAFGNGFWGSAIFALPNAKGNVFARPALSEFSNQIVDRPTLFAFAKGAGLMGEAGAEAIMPLTRTASGDLGVRMVGDVGVGMSMGGITFAPVNNFYGTGNMNMAELVRLLDERDRRIMEQLPAAIEDARRRGRLGVAA